MPFHEGTFEQRWGAMGDEAEAVFEAVYKHWGLKFQRYGWDRTEVSLRTVPAKIRFTPDYMTAKGLVEVQGFGGDRLLKIKDTKLDALHAWSLDFRVDLFVWDRTERAWAFVRLPELMHALGVAARGQYHDGPLYFAWKAEDIPTSTGWNPHPADDNIRLAAVVR